MIERVETGGASCGAVATRVPVAGAALPEVEEAVGRAIERTTNGEVGGHTFRTIPRRCSSSRTPYQNATKARANASDAFNGDSHEAKTVR